MKINKPIIWETPNFIKNFHEVITQSETNEMRKMEGQEILQEKITDEDEFEDDAYGEYINQEVASINS